MDSLAGIRSALAQLEEDGAIERIRAALESGIAPSDVLKACQDGMGDVGARFEEGEYFVTDLVFAGEIFNRAGAVLAPLLTAGHASGAGKIVIGTVRGDIHDLGKSIVVLMLRSAGFEVVDLGVDVPPKRFVEALLETGATVLGLSCLLTFAFGAMRETVAAVAEAGLRERVRIMVGGGPVDANFCAAVGADDWGDNANVAVRLAQRWLSPPAP
jgi:methylmalonyl-CoA mutase cobalamin-binding domain/chain